MSLFTQVSHQSHAWRRVVEKQLPALDSADLTARLLGAEGGVVGAQGREQLGNRTGCVPAAQGHADGQAHDLLDECPSRLMDDRDGAVEARQCGRSGSRMQESHRFAWSIADCRDWM